MNCHLIPLVLIASYSFCQSPVPAAASPKGVGALHIRSLRENLNLYSTCVQRFVIHNGEKLDVFRELHSSNLTKIVAVS